jgi:hypothetical protein
MNISVNGYSLFRKHVSKLNSLLLLMTVFIAACSVYDPKILDKPWDAGSEDASANGEGGSLRDGGGRGDSGGDSGRDSGGGTGGDGSMVEDAGFDASACPPGGDASCPQVCPEVCDGKDNDCDDEVDEGEQWAFKGVSCTVGVGECQVTGELICDSSDPSGPLVCDAIPEEPTAELCDGLDNNCDSKTDENFPDADSDGIADCVDPDYDGGVVVTYQRKKITIGAAYVDEILTNFPVLVNLSGDSELINDTQHDEDLYFTDSDGTDLLSFEVESYNRSSGDLIAWVKIPSISNSADTVFYLYYGDGADNWDTPNGYNETEVWSSNFVGVWHLNEDPSSTATDAIKDSSANTNHGDPNNFASDTRQTGAIGQAIYFDGNDDHVKVGVNASLDLTTYVTLSTWVKTDSFDSDGYFFIKRDGDNSQYGIVTQSSGARFGAVGGSTSNGDWLIATSDSTVNTWHHAVVVIDSSASNYAKVYRDSHEVASGDVTNPVSHPTVALFIGARGDGAGGTTYEYNGLIDEARVSSVIRSPAWIKAEFENQRSGSTFLTIETE